MSTFEPCTESIIVSPALRRRISEIMEEKGKAFTQQALAIRIGMHYETFRKKLRGERELNMFELRRIAEALHLTVERVLQVDTRDDEKKLKQLFAALDAPNSNLPQIPSITEILDIAQKLSNVAVGITERSMTLNDLGRAYFFNEQYEKAHEVWLSALDYSRRLVEKYDENECYHLILSNLLIVSTVINDYTGVDIVLEAVENAFQSDPVRLSIVHYTRAKISEKNNDILNAKKHAYTSLEYTILTNSSRRIGKAEATVAHYEFKEGNFLKAKELLESSMNHLVPYRYNWLMSTVDYVKTLLKLDEITLAETTILTALECDKLSPNSYIDILSKLRILLSICTGINQYAEVVLNDPNTSADIRLLAFKFLKKQCIRIGDEKSLMKYAIIEDGITINPDDIVDEEVL